MRELEAQSSVLSSDPNWTVCNRSMTGPVPEKHLYEAAYLETNENYDQLRKAIFVRIEQQESAMKLFIRQQLVEQTETQQKQNAELLAKITNRDAAKKKPRVKKVPYHRHGVKCSMNVE